VAKPARTPSRLAQAAFKIVEDLRNGRIGHKMAFKSPQKNLSIGLIEPQHTRQSSLRRWFIHTLLTI
jgi:hypothetical protein